MRFALIDRAKAEFPVHRLCRVLGVSRSDYFARAHCRTLSWLTIMPRAASISLTMPQTEREPKVQPNRVADDLGRKPVAGVARKGRRCHPIRLRDLARHGKSPI